MQTRLKLIPKTNLLQGKRIIITGCGFKPVEYRFKDIVTGEESHDSIVVDKKVALLEAGHIGQNIYLLAENYNLGCCAIGGFDNDKLSYLLDLTEDELPLYLFAIGNKND